MCSFRERTTSREGIFFYGTPCIVKILNSFYSGQSPKSLHQDNLPVCLPNICWPTKRSHQEQLNEETLCIHTFGDSSTWSQWKDQQETWRGSRSFQPWFHHTCRDALLLLSFTELLVWLYDIYKNTLHKLINMFKFQFKLSSLLFMSSVDIRDTL